MRDNNEHMEMSEAEPEDRTLKTQPNLQPPGPPRSPSLPGAIATADQDPLRTLILDAPPDLKWTHTRCVLSRLFGRAGVAALSNSIAPRDLIDLKGPFEVSAGSRVEIAWQGVHSDVVFAYIPEDITIPEFESQLLHILRTGRRTVLVPKPDSVGHSIVPAVPQNALDA